MYTGSKPGYQNQPSKDRRQKEEKENLPLERLKRTKRKTCNQRDLKLGYTLAPKYKDLKKEDFSLDVNQILMDLK